MTNPTFKDSQRSNIRKSISLLIIMMVLLSIVFASVGVYLGYDPIAIALIAIILAILSTLTGYWNADVLVLRMTHAQIISPESNQNLHNLVEEMALAAGIPKPKIAIVQDSAPNAFATGRNEEHALIAFTTGILEKMNREELQAVTAHEMSHLKNRDTLVNAIAAVTAGSIAIVVDISWRVAFGSRSKNSNPILLIGAIISIVLAPIAALLIQAAISRKREALADATAVAFTRDPTGLRKALELLRDDSTVVSTKSNAVAHLWIESPLTPGKKLSRLFDTHPPIQGRIDLLKSMEA